jgi:hypothetical protein
VEKETAVNTVYFNYLKSAPILVYLHMVLQLFQVRCMILHSTKLKFRNDGGYVSTIKKQAYCDIIIWNYITIYGGLDGPYPSWT